VAFTYEDSDLTSETSVSRLRYLVGDTEERLALLTDGEAAYLLGVHLTATAAVIPAMDGMIRKQSHRYTASSGAEREEQKERLAALRELRADLVAQGYTDTTNLNAAHLVTVARTTYGDYTSSELAE
jgi:hypothetical protein